MSQPSNATMPHVTAQDIVHTHLTTEFEQNSQGNAVLEFDHVQKIKEAIDKHLNTTSTNILGIGISIAVIAVFIIWICMPYTPTTMQSMAQMAMYSLAALALVGTVFAVIRGEQKRKKARKEIEQRLEGFAPSVSLLLERTQAFTGESLKGLFEHKITDYRKISQIPSLLLKLCCYEVTQTFRNLSDSEYTSETLWYSSVQQYQAKEQQDLRITFAIDIPTHLPASTSNSLQAFSNGENEWWIGKKMPSNTHIIWLLELYEPVTQMNWHVPIEVVS